MSNATATIGRWHGAGLMATTLLGTGVFILPQITVEIAGAGALWAWLLLTLAIIPVTLVFGRLASKFPHAGGPAHFVELAFGSFAGRCIGLSFLLLIPIGSAAAILIAFKFFTVFFPVTGIGELLVQMGMILLLLAINIRGIHVSAKLQFLLTLVIVAVVLLMLISAGFEVPRYHLRNALQQADFSAVMGAAGIAFWSFLGVEAMTHLATDFRDPKKDMLPAMMIGTILVGIIYIACTYLLIIMPGTSALAIVDVFDQLLGGYGAQVIGTLGIASGLATVNVYTAGSSRLLWSFSRDKVLPKYFDQLNQHQVPMRALYAILLLMLLAIVLTHQFGQQLEQLIAWTNGVFVVIYTATMLASFKLLSRKYLPIIILSCLFFAAIAISIGANMLYALLVLILLCPVLYWQKNYLSR
ncbi:MAG: L-methionine/branched-chain amino acid transporter [Pseudomonadales bacterium]|nr:L-methionine/branched-chain amino acid transporter [Pseudomonadales bacterium]NRA15861.1 L-methionine/branched-chain amino acid transporter [Oceanospirillaceae bacterium]